MALIKGITDYVRALGWIFHRRVFLFALIPGIMALVLSGAIFLSIQHYADDLGQWMWSWYTWDWGRSFIDTASTWIGGFIMAALSLILFKYVILIVSSPFMSPLSERLESLLTGEEEDIPISGKMMLEGLVRGIRITMRNIIRELGLTILLLLLSLFPFFAPFTGILILATQAYYAGFGNMDFTMERYFTIPEAVSFTRSHKMYALGNGLIFIGLLFIPLLGALVAVPLGAAAGTIGVVERS